MIFPAYSHCPYFFELAKFPSEEGTARRTGNGIFLLSILESCVGIGQNARRDWGNRQAEEMTHFAGEKISPCSPRLMVQNVDGDEKYSLEFGQKTKNAL